MKLATGFLRGMKPARFSILLALLLCMVLLAVSSYHFPLSYWLRYVERAPTEFGYSVLYGEIVRLFLGELYLILILWGMCLEEHSRTAPLIVEIGVLFETGIIPIFPLLYLSPVNPTTGLYWIYLIFFAPIILLFLIYFARSAKKTVDQRILYSLVTVSFIPVSLNTTGWILSNYTGTGGGLFFSALLFFVGWSLVWVGGILKYGVFSLLALVAGAIMIWSPFGVGFLLLGLAYMLRAQEYSKGFYLALVVVLVGFSIAIHNIVTAPPL